MKSPGDFLIRLRRLVTCPFQAFPLSQNPFLDLIFCIVDEAKAHIVSQSVLAGEQRARAKVHFEGRGFFAKFLCVEMARQAQPEEVSTPGSLVLEFGEVLPQRGIQSS